MIKAYKYRIYPNVADKYLLSRHFGCCRFIYNWALDLKIKAYSQKEKLTCIDIANKIPN